MISEADFHARGWEVVPSFAPGAQLPLELLHEMETHPAAPGKSSWGTRNMLFSLVLSMRPKVVLEVGAHIGSAAVVIGAALKANGFGTLYSLEPQDHYFAILESFVERAGLAQFVKPLKMLSTDAALDARLGEPVDIVFLDADHSYSAALKDMAICDRLLAQNGLILLDDVGPEASKQWDPEGRGGVRQALLDYTAGRDDLKVILLEPPFWLNPCGLGIVCKQQPA